MTTPSIGVAAGEALFAATGAAVDGSLAAGASGTGDAFADATVGVPEVDIGTPSPDEGCVEFGIDAAEATLAADAIDVSIVGAIAAGAGRAADCEVGWLARLSRVAAPSSSSS